MLVMWQSEAVSTAEKVLDRGVVGVLAFTVFILGTVVVFLWRENRELNKQLLTEVKSRETMFEDRVKDLETYANKSEMLNEKFFKATGDLNTAATYLKERGRGSRHD